MVPKEGAVPTTSHMTMATMIRLNMARHVVTTNLDGLHRKSGLEHHRNLTYVHTSLHHLQSLRWLEHNHSVVYTCRCLHGDRYIERCTNPACRHELERDRSVRQLFARSHLHVHDHSIGVCPKCGSAPPVRYTGMPGPGDDRSGMVGPTDEDCGTKDTHINFGEELDSLDWDEAGAACSAAALCIVAGTSMSLRHVTHFPFLAKKTVIVNLQETPDDQKADLRIFANSDEVFEGLMQRMNIPIDPRPDHQARDAVPKAEVPFFRNKRRWVRLQKAFVQGEWADFATRRALALLWNAAGMQFWRRRAVEGGLAAFQTSGTENEELLRSASDLSLDADIERVRSELSQ